MKSDLKDYTPAEIEFVLEEEAKSVIPSCP